jgi:hypothetical protein
MVESVPLAFGPRAAVPLTTPRRPGSVRRTSTLDMDRPDGVDGDVILTGAARDLLTTSPDTTPRVLEEAGLRGRVDFVHGRTVTTLAAVPDDERRVHELVGRAAASGFRGEVLRLLPEHAERRSPLYLLLDDVPAGALVSGFATRRDGPGPVRSATSNPPKPDLCAGWQRGGVMMQSVEISGRTPVAQGGPVPVEPGDDPYAWHNLRPLGAGGVRRRRRLDLVADGGMLVVNASFRDSYLGLDGVETAIHQYGLSGTVDAADLTIRSLSADAYVLPWLECPQAAGSAGRLVGHPVHELRRWVRTELVGISTCTHLNDMLRSLEDVVSLSAHLRKAGAAA